MTSSHNAVVDRSKAPQSDLYPVLVSECLAPRTDAERLRDAATLIRLAATELSAVRSVVAHVDGRHNLAELHAIAGDLDGFAETREAAR